jgi:hypothetical protein
MRPSSTLGEHYKRPESQHQDDGCLGHPLWRHDLAEAALCFLRKMGPARKTITRRQVRTIGSGILDSHSYAKGCPDQVTVTSKGPE